MRQWRQPARSLVTTAQLREELRTPVATPLSVLSGIVGLDLVGHGSRLATRGAAFSSHGSPARRRLRIGVMPSRAVARRAYQQARKRVRRKVDDRLLGEVAALYREYFDDRPWRVIAERFNVSETTAARYVVLARKAGLLPATEPGKKKA